MSSQCKGTTKNGSPCKITIVLPNGYCRVHQDQYVVEKEQDTREVEKECLIVESPSPEKNVPEEKSENVAINSNNSTSYVQKSASCKRWYIVPVVMMVFFWILSQLMRKNKVVNR